jgi:hypothetical protein
MKIAGLSFLLVGAIAVAFAATTPTLGNAWALATARGFFIPVESSLFTFRVTMENSGSGEWWIYGEDGKSYFALSSIEPRYFVQTKSDAAKCDGFLPQDSATWCSPTAVDTP